MSSGGDVIMIAGDSCSTYGHGGQVIINAGSGYYSDRMNIRYAIEDIEEESREYEEKRMRVRY